MLLFPLQAVAQAAPVHSVWAGAGQQDNGTSWTIEVTYYTDESVDIAYPSLACGGRLEMLGPAVGGGFRYREMITYDPRRICIDRGTVILHNDTINGISYTWFYPGREAEPGATGYLTYAPR